eukprot:jgi/Botrbrau1/5866/Bobra.0366s0045.1
MSFLYYFTIVCRDYLRIADEQICKKTKCSITRIHPSCTLKIALRGSCDDQVRRFLQCSSASSHPPS